MKIEGLRLFVLVSPFEDVAGAVIDRDGPWNAEMIREHGHGKEPGVSGLRVWEGNAEREPDHLVGGWDFEGTWRAPTAEEMARLAAGKLPLRGHAFPPLDALESFEVVR